MVAPKVKISSQSDKRLRRKTRKFCVDKQTDPNAIPSFGEGNYVTHVTGAITHTPEEIGDSPERKKSS